MNCGDHSTIERSLVSHPTLPLRPTRVAEQPVHRFAESLAHFISGAIGERDCNELVDRWRLLLAQDMKITFYQNRGFPRAGSGNDGDVAIERVRRSSLGWF